MKKERLQIECLRRLAQIVVDIPARQFDMNEWGKKEPCGTVGCIAGHASQNYWFKRYGIKSGWCGNILSINSNGDTITGNFAGKFKISESFFHDLFLDYTTAGGNVRVWRKEALEKIREKAAELGYELYWKKK